MENMSLMELISGVGFPIAVAAYLLIFMKKSLDTLTKVIDKLANLIDKKLS